MKMALLVNDKESRTALAGMIRSHGVVVDEYATAAKALGMLSAVRYDLIAIHWKVYPGLAAGDPSIKKLAAMIPVAHVHRNVLYWETALGVIDVIRTEGYANHSTHIVIIFPDLGNTNFGGRDRLSSEAVDADMAKRQPATIISGIKRDDIAAHIAKCLVDKGKQGMSESAASGQQDRNSDS